MAGGSCQTVSIAAAVQAAIEKAHRELLQLANERADSPLAGATYQQTVLRDGGLFRVDNSAKGETYSDILRHARKDSIEVEASASMPLEIMKYSIAWYSTILRGPCQRRVRRSARLAVAWLIRLRQSGESEDRDESAPRRDRDGDRHGSRRKRYSMSATVESSTPRWPSPACRSTWTCRTSRSSGPTFPTNTHRSGHVGSASLASRVSQQPWPTRYFTPQASACAICLLLSTNCCNSCVRPSSS